MCITQRGQTAHCGVRIQNFAGLWLLLKGQSDKIHLLVNTSIMSESILSKKSIKRTQTLWCHACTPRSHNFRILLSDILAKLKDWIRKYILYIRGLDGFKSGKKIEVENLVTPSLCWPLDGFLIFVFNLN